MYYDLYCNILHDEYLRNFRRICNLTLIVITSVLCHEYIIVQCRYSPGSPKTDQEKSINSFVEVLSLKRTDTTSNI